MLLLKFFIKLLKQLCNPQNIFYGSYLGRIQKYKFIHGFRVKPGMTQQKIKSKFFPESAGVNFCFRKNSHRDCLIFNDHLAVWLLYLSLD